VRGVSGVETAWYVLFRLALPILYDVIVDLNSVASPPRAAVLASFPDPFVPFTVEGT